MSAVTTSAPLTMLTFQPMVDSETTRLVLRYNRAPYREVDHLIGLASLFAKLHGGGLGTPYLYSDAVKITGPRPLAEHFDTLLPEESKLIPGKGPLSTEVNADWQTFNSGMGTDTAVFAYYYLLPERSLMAPIFAAPVPWYERLLMPIAYPLMNVLFQKALNLSGPRAVQAEANIRAAFDATDKRIADGRTFLTGDRLTLGDIGLAGASAPLLQPNGYGATMPPVDAMPAPVSALVVELRGRPTAALVQRIYDALPAPVYPPIG